MDSDIRAQITRDDILSAIATLDSGEAHLFGPSSTYDLIENGRRYPPKAVLGLAARRALGRALRPEEFSGGSTSWAFRLLEERGFKIERKPLNNDGREPADPEERIIAKLQLAAPDPDVRQAAIALLAWAIEIADEDRSDAWYLRETDRGLRLMTGRLLACEIRRSKLRVSVIGPVPDEVLSTLAGDVIDEFKWVTGGLIIEMPLDRAAAASLLLKDAMDAFIDSAMTRVKRGVDLNDHSGEALQCLSSLVGRDLPRPELRPGKTDDDIDEPEDDEETASREPKVRGRAPIFENGQRSVASLLSDIELGVIALPDLQRPFVWEDTKVRDLLDSLFVGFPVGTLVFWHTANEREARALGAQRPELRATTLVIDGQQRLTSLYAVMKGAKVMGKDGTMRKITVAFRPRDGRFEVADAAIRKDPEFLADVTDLWSGARTKPQIRKEMMKALIEKGRLIDDNYEGAVEENLDRAHSISNYRFPTVDIRKTAETGEASEEDVADIFVRINNQGVRLGQADFVLTLLSVYHGKLRDKLEDSARAMSTGAVVALDTQQLLRAVCGVAFGRARMSAVYRFLRGVDPVSGEATPERRVALLQKLDSVADQCIALTPWRDYLLRVKHAGLVSHSLIASKNAIVNAYAFYIRGRELGAAKPTLDAAISRWVFASLLTARYSSSSETIFEQDLARLSRVPQQDAEAFMRELDSATRESLTGDYWTQTLVSDLETQRARAPAALGFRAAQVILGARALFSDQLLRNLLDSTQAAGRAAREAHHLFPVKWLHSHRVTDRRLVNQVANLTEVGWHENSAIGDQSPAVYVPRLREQLAIDDDQWGRMCAEHALPLGWEKMDYPEFLRERRIRMAELIRVAFRKLGGEPDAAPLTPPWFLPGTEEVWRQIADTERALRALVREVYVERFRESAAQAIEGQLQGPALEVLKRGLRSRPSGSDPLTVVDYLYLGQLPALLFADKVWPMAKSRLRVTGDAKQLLQTAISQIAPVRNEIAHVREIPADRLLRASVACKDVLALLLGSAN